MKLIILSTAAVIVFAVVGLSTFACLVAYGEPILSMLGN